MLRQSLIDSIADKQGLSVFLADHIENYYHSIKLLIECENEILELAKKENLL